MKDSIFSHDNLVPLITVLLVLVLGIAAGLLFPAAKTSYEPLAYTETTDDSLLDPQQIVTIDEPFTCNKGDRPRIKVVSPNGGEAYVAGEQIDVKWKSCNVKAPISIILIQHNPFVPYKQEETQGDYAGFVIGGFDGYVGTADDGEQTITLPKNSAEGFLPGQNYYFSIMGREDDKYGPGFVPGDLSDSLFTIN